MVRDVMSGKDNNALANELLLMIGVVVVVLVAGWVQLRPKPVVPARVATCDTVVQTGSQRYPGPTLLPPGTPVTARPQPVSTGHCGAYH